MENALEFGPRRRALENQGTHAIAIHRAGSINVFVAEMPANRLDTAAARRRQAMLKATRKPILAVLALAALALVGCGTKERTANELRPPLPIQLDASLMPKKISLSPNQIGGGPITLIVSNLTGSDQRVTFGANSPSGSSDLRIDSQSATIAPNNTATMKADLTDGTYSLSVEDDAIPASLLSVSGERPSAQNDLMLP
jgi:hypothetical protein